jgi:NADPH:quinone reductase-like Zn-dependent oxidoreductase
VAAWSLNSRDIAILLVSPPADIDLNRTHIQLQGMHVPMKLPIAPLEAPFIPVSDGAGVVVEVGSSIAKFQVGDRVMTVFKPSWETGYYKREYEPSNLSGKTVPGVLSEYVVLDQEYWTWMRKNLTFLEASTLPVAGLAAWQSLFGVATYSSGPGQTLLVEGTGGVSMAALQVCTASCHKTSLLVY